VPTPGAGLQGIGEKTLLLINEDRIPEAVDRPNQFPSYGFTVFDRALNQRSNAAFSNLRQN
jgi:hypothetical protein